MPQTSVTARSFLSLPLVSPSLSLRPCPCLPIPLSILLTFCVNDFVLARVTVPVFLSHISPSRCPLLTSLTNLQATGYRLQPTAYTDAPRQDQRARHGSMQQQQQAVAMPLSNVGALTHPWISAMVAGQPGLTLPL